MLITINLFVFVCRIEWFSNNPCYRNRATVLRSSEGNSEVLEDKLDKRLRLFFESKESSSLAISLMDNFILRHKLIGEIPYDRPLLKKIDETINHVSNYDYLFKSLYEPINLNQFPESPESHTVGNMKRQSFKLHIAYNGNAFCGWQIQANNDLPSVQQILIDIINPILKSEKSTKPIDIRVCGRTDSGVSAFGQICRVRTQCCDVSPYRIQAAINDRMSSLDKIPNIWCTKVERVSEKFHPTFDATCRAYVYILDAEALESMASELLGRYTPIGMIVSVVDSMLRHLQEKELDYFSMSFGPVKTETTNCTLYHAKARVVEDESGHLGLCIELVSNRFLRRMVRILVATLIREALATINQQIDSREATITTKVLSLIETGDRSKTAKAASQKGLFFISADFSTL